MYKVIKTCAYLLTIHDIFWKEINFDENSGDLEIACYTTEEFSKELFLGCFSSHVIFETYTFHNLVDSGLITSFKFYAQVKEIKQAKMDNFQAEDIMQENYEDQSGVQSKCPDCKDGFYYPLFGPPEPCQTCGGTIVCPGPPEFCSTCEGTNYYLGHPQGTPGPCPDCNIDLKINSGDKDFDEAFKQFAELSPLIELAHQDELVKQRFAIWSGDATCKDFRIKMLIDEIRIGLGRKMNNSKIVDFQIDPERLNFFDILHADTQRFETGVWVNMLGRKAI